MDNSKRFSTGLILILVISGAFYLGYQQGEKQIPADLKIIEICPNNKILNVKHRLFLKKS